MYTYATKLRVHVPLGPMQPTKQSALAYYLMQGLGMQATNQVAYGVLGPVFPQPGWVEKGMQCDYCSKLEPNTPQLDGVIPTPKHPDGPVWSVSERCGGANGVLCGRLTTHD